MGNTRAADEFHDPASSALLFSVETDDESGHHPEAVGGDFVDRIFEGAAGVLQFSGRGQAGLIGGFDTQEDAFKAGVHHHGHQFVVGGEVDGGFRGKAEGIAVVDLPLLQHRQEQLHVALVANEVVIHQKDRTAPPQVVEILKLCD